MKSEKFKVTVWKIKEDFASYIEGTASIKLSRKNRNLDRFGVNKRKAVKKKPESRQVWSQQAKSCQEKAGI
ncbi:hypothetical protein DYI25_07560 [Mesobacillus boroniphilus]|uniref:Uncharacterized protein n=1 Tax=Mesobacillus boroniphilus TaxID=308892 RepID=A0A944CK81_9BACI|nr:hypothetical protein [Mesobacillus boroniphilus]